MIALILFLLFQLQVPRLTSAQVEDLKAHPPIIYKLSPSEVSMVDHAFRQKTYGTTMKPALQSLVDAHQPKPLGTCSTTGYVGHVEPQVVLYAWKVGTGCTGPK